jgi:hypothetical protein
MNGFRHFHGMRFTLNHAWPSNKEEIARSHMYAANLKLANQSLHTPSLSCDRSGLNTLAVNKKHHHALRYPERRRAPARFLQRGKPESKDLLFSAGLPMH